MDVEGGPSNEACLRAGWIYHLKTTFGKSWQQKWVTVKADGTLTVASCKEDKPRNTHTYNIRRECMLIKTASQCQHLLPPAEVESSNLLELLMTGDRRLAFCALSRDESELWYNCIEIARSEKDLPTPRGLIVSRKEAEAAEKGSAGCCACSKGSSKVKVVDFDPPGD